MEAVVLPLTVLPGFWYPLVECVRRHRSAGAWEGGGERDQKKRREKHGLLVVDVLWQSGRVVVWCGKVGEEEEKEEEKEGEESLGGFIDCLKQVTEGRSCCRYAVVK